MLPPKSAEFSLIDRFRTACRTRSDVLLEIGDDAAVVRWPASRGLLTTDMLLEGVHFECPPATPRQVGRKAMAVNLSDIAAMGGQPDFALISLALTRGAPPDFADELFAGLQEMAERFETVIIGGDTNSWNGPVIINVAVTGTPHPRGPVTRSGARPGDWIMVTGSLGGSLSGHHLDFTPRVREARQLHELVELHAMMDISDGLAGDLFHILEESRAGAVLEADLIPVSEAARNMHDSRSPLEHALGDGEDFELLFTVAPPDGERLLRQQPLDVPLSRIGEITAGTEVLLKLPDGIRQPLSRLGWSHPL